MDGVRSLNKENGLDRIALAAARTGGKILITVTIADAIWIKSNRLAIVTAVLLAHSRSDRKRQNHQYLVALPWFWRIYEQHQLVVM
ncbi:hypothetical protein [Pseudofrankia sp. BMG5.36]|uniref:hypothetical protein n=1 Tax=Pseudofrankia sp. BMG5.36 TaxID=1834512 RepID=UPI001041F0F2|nr:hypothetical protein [Pseudofrankia sp. BMG5.36]